MKLSLKTWSIVILISSSCSLTVNRNIRKIEKDNISASIEIPDNESLFTPYFDSLMNRPSSDTMTVTDHNGKKLHLIQAVLDSTGTLVATETLNPVIVVARFKNVAERNGEINIAFDIKVPEKLLDKAWQVIMYPKAVILEDTVHLEHIIISGEIFRKNQLRGYELYDNFISSIITDSSKLIYTETLEAFIQRNIPKLAALKADSGIVADNTVKGIFGITYSDALKYFKKKSLIAKNNRKKNSIQAKYAKYVKNPFSNDGVRLDTVVTDYGTELRYGYTEMFRTRPGLKKIDIIVEGVITCNGGEKYRISPTAPLTFHVASFSTLTEHKERFLNKIIERKAVSHISANICFEPGKHIIDEAFDSNDTELEDLKYHIATLIDNREFNIDSLVITTSCSPEGDYSFNRRLSVRRGESIAEYIRNFVAGYCAETDSSCKENYSYSMKEDAENMFCENGCESRVTELSFSVQNIAENWNDLNIMIMTDTLIEDKEGLMAICNVKNNDIRKARLSRHPEYQYILQNIYPQLRNVRFDFHLHRKGMVQDTIHTTIPDTVYRKGLNALENRDYKTALKYLGQYRDINSALAYLALEYNASAMEILESMPPSGKRDYLLAIANSRTGNEQTAVQYFLNAVNFDPSLAFRGNLDPEISILVKKYNLGL